MLTEGKQYGKLVQDKAFINAVAVELGKRDISKFNPGERPSITAAKLAVIESTETEADRMVRLLVNIALTVSFHILPLLICACWKLLTNGIENIEGPIEHYVFETWCRSCL